MPSRAQRLSINNRNLCANSRMQNALPLNIWLPAHQDASYKTFFFFPVTGKIRT